MSKHHFDQQIDEQLAQLPNEVQPERDLWPGIEMALAKSTQEHIQKPAYKNWAPMALAASVALVAVLMFGLRPGDQGQNLLASLSAQHEQQKQALLVAFKDQPALTDNWQQQLSDLDEAAAAIKKALAEEPDNLALLKMLQQVYQQQINLIERVHTPKWQQI